MYHNQLHWFIMLTTKCVSLHINFSWYTYYNIGQPTCTSTEVAKDVPYSTNVPVLLNCTVNHGYPETRAIGFNGRCECTSTDDLPPGIVVKPSRSNGPDNTTVVVYSVEIADPDIRYVHLWCCWDLGNGTILEGEHFNLRKIPSDPEDSLGGK